MKNIILFISIIVLALLSCNKETSPFEVSDLTCEYLTNPIGVDMLEPRLSWQLESDQCGQKQTAYHLLVASSQENLAKNKGDLWDSGKIESGQSRYMKCKGKRFHRAFGKTYL